MNTNSLSDVREPSAFGQVDGANDPKFDPAASKARKGMPLFDGCMLYFPDALLAVAEHSRKANDKHNPGEPLHWSKHKSNDHPNCIARHLTDIGPNWDQVDPEFGSLHAVALAWRALALLQIAIEAQRGGMTPREYLKGLEALAQKPEVIESGWIPHAGGPRPCDPDKLVQVRHRNGYLRSHSAGAFEWDWKSLRLCDQIVAWRPAGVES